MKSLLFAAISFTISSLICPSASAQKGSYTGDKKAGSQVTQVKFIEGIEIKRDLLPHTEAAADMVFVKTPAVVNSINTIEQSLHIQFKYAQLLNRNVEAVSNISLFNFIEDWWETHYRYGGTDKKGIDCSAFTGLLMNTIYSIEMPRTAKEQYNACEKMEREKLSEGDLVFFNTRGGVSHVGVYLGEGYFVHASTGNGVTINNLDDDYYSARFLGGGRVMRVVGDVVGRR